MPGRTAISPSTSASVSPSDAPAEALAEPSRSAAGQRLSPRRQASQSASTAGSCQSEANTQPVAFDCTTQRSCSSTLVRVLVTGWISIRRRPPSIVRYLGLPDRTEPALIAGSAVLMDETSLVRVHHATIEKLFESDECRSPELTMDPPA